MGENITMAHFSQKLSMWLAEKSCWATVPTAQGWRFCISDVCHVLTAEIRPATSSISCSPPLHFLVVPTYISLSLAKRVQAGHPRTAQFNYSQLRWSRCQILALIWKTNRAVAWWNMLDLITGRGGIHRETDTEGTFSLINNSTADQHDMCKHKIMKFQRLQQKVHHH